MTEEHLTQGFQNPFDKGNGHYGLSVTVTILFLVLLSSFLLSLIDALPHSSECPLRVPTPTQILIYMDDFCCYISLLHDNVITSIIEDPDDSQLVVQWVVRVKTHVLVGVCNFPV